MFGLVKKPEKSEDLVSLLKTTNTEIKKVFYEVSRCVNDGEYHQVLTPKEVNEVQVTEGIPLACRVDLAGYANPLVISVKPAGVRIYASFSNREPTE